MAEAGSSYCPRCGARLRRGRPFGKDHVRLVAGVAQRLRIPGHLLGFPGFGTQTNWHPDQLEPRAGVIAGPRVRVGNVSTPWESEKVPAYRSLFAASRFGWVVEWVAPGRAADPGWWVEFGDAVVHGDLPVGVVQESVVAPAE